MVFSFCNIQVMNSTLMKLDLKVSLMNLRLITSAVLVLSTLLLPLSGSADYLPHPDAKVFVDRMVSEHGFERAEVESLLKAATKQQSIIDAIEEKARHPAYEVLIRVVVSSNISQRSQTILSNIQATFALYDSPGKNGFKFVPAKDIDSFITSFIMR